MLISQHSLTIAENVSSMNVWWKKDGDLSTSFSFGFNETLKVFKLPVILVSQQTHMNARKIQIIMQHYATFIISVHSLYYLLAFGPQSVLHFALSLFSIMISLIRHTIFIVFLKIHQVHAFMM